MASKKPIIEITNDIVQEISGIEGLRFNAPDHVEMNEGERILSRAYTHTFLHAYFTSGRCLSQHLSLCGYKKSHLNASWWRQFDHIKETAFTKYSKNSKYFAEASRHIASPNDEELLRAGDPAAISRLNLIGQCAALTSAIFPESDHAFFKIAIEDMPRWVHEKTHPKFTEAPDLTEDELDKIQQLCIGLKHIYDKNPDRDANEIAAQYIMTVYIAPPFSAPVEEEILPQLRSIAPTKHIMPNNKITNLLSAGSIGYSESLDDFFAVRVSKESAKNPVISNIMVAYDGKNVEIASRRPFTEYDRNVYNAVVSLYVHGDQQHVITPAMVYRAMTGLPEASSPSPQQIEAVTESIDKMRFIRVIIDCTEELQLRRAKLNSVPISKGKIDTYLLNADGTQVEAGGHKVEAYRINKPPVLYEYSRATKQVLTVPSDLLAIKEADDKGVYNSFVANNDSRIQIKGYLLRRIETMKGDNAIRNHTISLVSYEKDGKHHAGVYEIGGKSNPSTKEATHIRKYVAAALDFWKAEKYIKGYEFVKNGGRAITGVEIKL